MTAAPAPRQKGVAGDPRRASRPGYGGGVVKAPTHDDNTATGLDGKVMTCDRDMRPLSAAFGGNVSCHIHACAARG